MRSCYKFPNRTLSGYAGGWILDSQGVEEPLLVCRQNPTEGRGPLEVWSLQEGWYCVHPEPADAFYAVCGGGSTLGIASSVAGELYLHLFGEKETNLYRLEGGGRHPSLGYLPTHDAWCIAADSPASLQIFTKFPRQHGRYSLPPTAAGAVTYPAIAPRERGGALVWREDPAAWGGDAHRVGMIATDGSATAITYTESGWYDPSVVVDPVSGQLYMACHKAGRKMGFGRIGENGLWVPTMERAFSQFPHLSSAPGILGLAHAGYLGIGSNDKQDPDEFRLAFHAVSRDGGMTWEELGTGKEAPLFRQTHAGISLSPSGRQALCWAVDESDPEEPAAWAVVVDL